MHNNNNNIIFEGTFHQDLRTHERCYCLPPGLAQRETYSEEKLLIQLRNSNLTTWIIIIAQHLHQHSVWWLVPTSMYGQEPAYTALFASVKETSQWYCRWIIDRHSRWDTAAVIREKAFIFHVLAS